ncbi:MAG: FAD-dependent oxidoreductase, partial [Halioglobus sp.]|nr:FAD-dependent oxidoreductase [Halioglobus sp.]
VERQARLGGSLVLASTVHRDNQRFLDWLRAEIARLPIELRTGVEADVQLLRKENPDAVIVATGARIANPQIDGLASTRVLTGALVRQLLYGRLERAEAWRLPAWQARLAGAVLPRLERWLSPRVLRSVSRAWMPLGRRVVIVGGDIAAVELAEFLARRRRLVYLVDGGNKLIPEVGKKRRHEHMDRLDSLRVTVNTGVEVQRIEEGCVVIRTLSGERRIEGDTILVAGNPVADTTLADEFRAAGFAVHTIGDCTGLGLIAGATADAAQAVAAISAAGLPLRFRCYMSSSCPLPPGPFLRISICSGTQ